ncbi:MAG: recombinase family protein [Clostridia bacterium]|nr:recombinase family protein [Clostridia bacterium]
MQEKSEMDTVAIYIRLSKEDSGKGNEESESIQNQRMILDNYAANQGWSIYDRYIDEDWSGSDRGRPEFHRLINDAEAGKFNIVLVKTQSRFARDSKYIEDYVHNLFMEKGIRFVSLVDNIDTSQAGSKLNSRVHAIFDEEQLDLLSSNIRRSFEEKSRQGQFFGSMPPYGYKKDPQDKNHLIIDNEAAKVVRTIFEMTATGYTYLEIAQHLNHRGYLIPSQYKKQQGYKVDGMYDRHMKLGKWTRDIVRTFLTNEVYRGTIINHKSTVVNFRTKKKRNLPKEFHIKTENMHEAIIDEKLWNAVQEIRNTRRKSGNGDNGKKHPLSGKVFCKKCGSKMYKCKSGGIEYFRCYKASSTGECDNNKRIRLDILESIIIDKINELLSMYIDSEYLRKNVTVTNRLENELSACIKRKSDFEKVLESKREGLKNLLKAYTDNVVERSIYEEMQNDYLREKNECQKHITAIESQIELIKQSVLNQKDKESILKKYTHIDTLTIPIVQEFIDSIIISEVSSQNGQRDIIINMAV